MIFIYITLGVIVLCLILMLILMLFADATKSHKLGSASSVTLLISFIAFICGASYLNLDEQKEIEKSIPTALDVYRGNTTLEIIYRDGVPVDSVVVFKHKVYGANILVTPFNKNHIKENW